MNYKQKYKLLLGGIVLFIIIAYNLAFGKTWHLYSNSKGLEQQLSSAGQAWQEIDFYQKQLEQLESSQGNTAFTQKQLFQHVATFCQEENLMIVEMPESQIYEQEDMEILHNTIKIKGTYIPSVKLLYDLEQRQKLGRIVSVKFSLEKNYQTRKQELTTQIQLQNIQSKQK